MSIHVIAISGSLRLASTNSGLLRCALAHLPEGMTMEILDISQLPFFNGDLEKDNRPAVVDAVLTQMASANAFVFACPEYNYSIAPALKNAIDWASRVPNNSILGGKPVAILGSGGGMGTSRAQYHLRQVCTCVNLLPLNKPEVFANAFTGSFDAAGDVVDDKIKSLVAQQMLALSDWIRKVNA